MSLREAKRKRTRQAIVDAACDLFERQGYERTTVAEIAAAADIGTRTFFSYFPSKEELPFADSEARRDAALASIATRGPDDSPAQVLLRALHDIGNDPDPKVRNLSALRMRLIRTVPAVRGRGLQVQLEIQREIARSLAAAFPDQLDEVTAAALTGAFVGAVGGATAALTEQDPPADPAALQERVQQATALALAPWLSPTSGAGPGPAARTGP